MNTSVYNDPDITLRHHRLGYFDLGLEMEPLLRVLSSNKQTSFQRREIIQRTAALALATSPSKSVLISHSDKLGELALTTLALVGADSLNVSGLPEHNFFGSNLLAIDLLDSLQRGGRVSEENYTDAAPKEISTFEIHWIVASELPLILQLLGRFDTYSGLRGCIFIVNHCHERQQIPNNLTKRPFSLIEGAAGLGEIYFF